MKLNWPVDTLRSLSLNQWDKPYLEQNTADECMRGYTEPFETRTLVLHGPLLYCDGKKRSDSL